FWTLCVLFVALRVTLRFCKVSDACLRLEAPFHPSATDFEGSKQAKSQLRFRPDFVVTYVALCVASDIALKKRFCLCAVISGWA
ncbi:hypothetical protein A584_05612, partial [Pseudomonas syringae pv. theae ICMP 3923]|uniref:hypothetical protein n=1 Tax=Pseudomonas syringae TaxID=317 RepID=UPI0003582ABD